MIKVRLSNELWSWKCYILEFGSSLDKKILKVRHRKSLWTWKWTRFGFGPTSTGWPWLYRSYSFRKKRIMIISHCFKKRIFPHVSEIIFRENGLEMFVHMSLRYYFVQADWRCLYWLITVVTFASLVNKMIKTLKKVINLSDQRTSYVSTQCLFELCSQDRAIKLPGIFLLNFNKTKPIHEFYYIQNMFL